jgi:hypothetical protein
MYRFEASVLATRGRSYAVRQTAFLQPISPRLSSACRPRALITTRCTCARSWVQASPCRPADSLLASPLSRSRRQPSAASIRGTRDLQVDRDRADSHPRRDPHRQWRLGQVCRSRFGRGDLGARRTREQPTRRGTCWADRPRCVCCMGAWRISSASPWLLHLAPQSPAQLDSGVGRCVLPSRAADSTGVSACRRVRRGALARCRAAALGAARTHRRGVPAATLVFVAELPRSSTGAPLSTLRSLAAGRGRRHGLERAMEACHTPIAADTASQGTFGTPILPGVVLLDGWCARWKRAIGGHWHRLGEVRASGSRGGNTHSRPRTTAQWLDSLQRAARRRASRSCRARAR